MVLKFDKSVNNCIKCRLDAAVDGKRRWRRLAHGSDRPTGHKRPGVRSDGRTWNYVICILRAMTRYHTSFTNVIVNDT